MMSLIGFITVVAGGFYIYHQGKIIDNLKNQVDLLIDKKPDEAKAEADKEPSFMERVSSLMSKMF